MGATRLFDAYIVVDWSSRNALSPAKPTKDALWIGEASADADLIEDSYWRGRQACIAYLRQRLIDHVAAKRRVLIGFDLPYGYPRGFAQALALDQSVSAWRATWNELTRLIVDEENNNNNRFQVAIELNKRCGGQRAGPLWGCPTGTSDPMLTPLSPGYPYDAGNGILLQRMRWADQHEPGVQPVWKLYGVGSVGGQILTGIPAVASLHDDPLLAPFSKVWPFETGFTDAPTPDSGPFILHAEIWPGIVPELDSGSPIRDQAQVRSLARLLKRQDELGRLGSFFAFPTDLPDRQREDAIQEEAWLLGAGMILG